MTCIIIAFYILQCYLVIFNKNSSCFQYKYINISFLESKKIILKDVHIFLNILHPHFDYFLLFI